MNTEECPVAYQIARDAGIGDTNPKGETGRGAAPRGEMIHRRLFSSFSRLSTPVLNGQLTLPQGLFIMSPTLSQKYLSTRGAEYGVRSQREKKNTERLIAYRLSRRWADAL